MSTEVVRWDVLGTDGSKVDHIAVNSSEPAYLVSLMALRGWVSPHKAYTVEAYGHRISIQHPEYGELYILAKVG